MAEGARTDGEATTPPPSGGTTYDRAVAEAERVVRENRFTVAVVFPLVGAVLLVGSAEGLPAAALAAALAPVGHAGLGHAVGGFLTFNAALIMFGTLVMRSPLLVGVAPLLDRRAVAALGTATLFSYGIEMVGIATDWPYGAFEYLVDLGPMVAGVPLGLPVFFLPLVVNAYLLTLLTLRGLADHRAVRLPATVAIVLAVDLVLDPGAVAIGFWAYDAGGAYYGVPLSNYLGWLFSGTVAAALVDLAFDPDAVRARLDACEFVLDDLVSFVLLWGAVNLLYANWLAVVVAGLFVGGLVRSGRFDFDVVGAWNGVAR
jgi:putative membrane protein